MLPSFSTYPVEIWTLLELLASSADTLLTETSKHIMTWQPPTQDREVKHSHHSSIQNVMIIQSGVEKKDSLGPGVMA